MNLEKRMIEVIRDLIVIVFIVAILSLFGPKAHAFKAFTALPDPNVSCSQNYRIQALDGAFKVTIVREDRARDKVKIVKNVEENTTELKIIEVAMENKSHLLCISGRDDKLELRSKL